jgi:ABC-type multidrug transport system fused ATPase/permease subunit
MAKKQCSTLKKAGYVVFMENGQIAGEGTHEEFLRSIRVYRRLYYKQWADTSAMY